MKKFKEAYLNYVGPEGTVSGIKLKTFKGIDAKNSYHVDYIGFVASAVNYVVGLMAYHSNKENKFNDDPKANTVIMTSQNLAKAIGCSHQHASYVLTQLKELFNLEFTRQKWRGGARTITLNKQFIEFLKIYSEQDYSDYIEAHNITDGKLLYALRQVYNYRIWEVADSQLKPSTRQEKQDFIDKMRNHHHRVYTIDRKNDTRIRNIQKGSKYLTELELAQLDRVREESKLGKLVHYVFTVLIKLEQKISAIVYHKEKKNKESKKIDTSHIDRNMEPRETEAFVSSTAETQKIPEVHEVLTPRDYIEVIFTWNNMIQDQAIPEVKELTPGRIKSIDSIVKSYGKEKLLQAINNVKNLEQSKNYKYKIKFERFIQDETFVNVLELDSFNDVALPEWFEGYVDSVKGDSFKSTFDISTIPNFKTLSEAKKWYKQN